MKQDISEYIKIKRTEKGMSQENLGDLLYVSRQQISNWENRRQKPGIEHIKKMAEILDFSDEMTSYFIDMYVNNDMKYTEESFKEIETVDEAIQFTEAMIKDLRLDNNCSETLKYLLSNYLLLCTLYTMAIRGEYNSEDNPYDIYILYAELEDILYNSTDMKRRYDKYGLKKFEFETNGIETALATQYEMHLDRIIELDGMLKVQFEASVCNLINHIKEKTNPNYTIFDKYDLEERDLAAEMDEY